jgi:hypothetical protein
MKHLGTLAFASSVALTVALPISSARAQTSSRAPGLHGDWTFTTVWRNSDPAGNTVKVRVRSITLSEWKALGWTKPADVWDAEKAYSGLSSSSDANGKTVEQTWAIGTRRKTVVLYASRGPQCTGTLEGENSIAGTCTLFGVPGTFTGSRITVPLKR